MIILFVCFLGFRAVCPLEYAWGHGAFAYLLIDYSETVLSEPYEVFEKCLPTKRMGRQEEFL